MTRRVELARQDVESGEASEQVLASIADMISLIRYAIRVSELVAASTDLHDNRDLKIDEVGRPEPWSRDVERVESAIFELKALTE